MKDDVVGFDSLYVSMMKCKRGVLWKASVQHFYLNSIEEVLNLSQDLISHTYKAKPPYKFKITSPKEREIVSICFRDRVFQRSLNDNVIYPTMTKPFIYDNCACQKGKGTDFARKRLKCFLNKYFRKHGTDGFVLQIDVKKYYQNIPHSKAIKLFEKYLDKETVNYVTDIMNNQYVGDIGFNPGSQLIQILGVSYLNYLDHFIKEKLHVKFYVRYMDDLIIIHDNKNELNDFKNKIGYQLSLSGLQYHPTKTKIYELNNGISFLGFDYHLTKTGKVLMTALSQKVKNNRQKYNKLKKKVLSGNISVDKYNESLDCWFNHLSKGNNNNLIRKLKKQYCL